MLELGVAAKVSLEVLLTPLGRAHEVGIALSLGIEKGIERVEPAPVQAARGELAIGILGLVAQGIHALGIAVVVCGASVPKKGKRGVRPHRRRHVEGIGQHTPLTRGVRAHPVVYELGEDPRVEGKALPEEAKALVLAPPVGICNRVDLRCPHLGGQIVVALPLRVLARKCTSAHIVTIDGRGKRIVLVVAAVISSTRKEARHGIDVRPGVEGRGVQGERHE